MKTPKIAIIGAGPAGLVSAKYALENGFETTIFEKESELGGLWNPSTGAMWESMHANLSNFTCIFSDLFDCSSDRFPSALQL